MFLCTPVVTKSLGVSIAERQPLGAEVNCVQNYSSHLLQSLKLATGRQPN